MELPRRGLTDSAADARALIADGRVLVGNAPATNPGRLVAPADAIRVLPPPARFVGRGGEKLEAALDAFGIDVAGRRCLDAGSSTGGFTDALLQAGAASVVAVDVGRHQLHERLRADPRVDSREQTDIRDVTLDDLGGAVPVVVVDLSFIGIRSVIGVLTSLLDSAGDLVVLVKPQFEADRVEVSRGQGVIREPEVWRRVLGEAVVAIEDAGAAIMGAMVSPLRGADGNAEFLLHARPTAAVGIDAPAIDLDRVVDEARAARQGNDRR